ncbi:MAG: hypothetical protein AAF197_11785 [Pseudomonadota bacterium]
MKRLVLENIIKLMVIAFVAGFLFILFIGASQHDMESELLRHHDGIQADFKEIRAGDTEMRRVNNQPVWVTNLDAKLVSDLQVLPPFVETSGGCAPVEGYCVLDALTERSGILISFSETKPRQLPRDTEFLGGFVNPSNGLVYDRLGRIYLDQASSTALELVTPN